MDTVDCPSVNAVVPPLDVVVRSNKQHVDGLASNPGVSCVVNKFPLSLRRWNMSGTSSISASGRKGRAINFRIYFYVGLFVR